MIPKYRHGLCGTGRVANATLGDYRFAVLPGRAAADHDRVVIAHVGSSSPACSVTTVSALTASITHQVNQPLSAIITNAIAGLRMLDRDPPNSTARARRSGAPLDPQSMDELFDAFYSTKRRYGDRIVGESFHHRATSRPPLGST